MLKEIGFEEALKMYLNGQGKFVTVYKQKPIKMSDGGTKTYYTKSKLPAELNGLMNSDFFIDVESLNENEEFLIEVTSEYKELPQDGNYYKHEVKQEPNLEMPENADIVTEKRVDLGKMNALLQAGWSVVDVARELNVSKTTIYKYRKRIADGEIRPNSEKGTYEIVKEYRD